jgi:hypothetical protein
VFLHEMGHTLGVVHESDPASLMSATYDTRQSAFSPASVAIMSITVDHRWGRPGQDDERAYRQRLLSAFEGSLDTWVAADRDAMLASLRSKLAASPAPPVASAPQPPTPEENEALKGVSADDRALYQQAVEQEPGERYDEAWKAATPLFARYPDSYAIQDLRCRVALILSAVWQAARRECQRLMDLSRGKPAPSK